MNTIYRIVWNAATGKWVVASELAKGRKKNSSCTALLAASIVLIGVSAVASPAQAAATYTGTADCSGSGGTLIAYGSGSTGTYPATAFKEGIAIGNGASANATNANCSVASPGVIEGWGAIAMGSGAYVGSGGLALGYLAKSTGMDALALGPASQATGSSSVALGAGSSDGGRNNVVSVGSGGDAFTRAPGQGSHQGAVDMSYAPQTRQLINLAAGTENTDAVNVSQLTPVVAGLGGGASIDSTTGAVTGPTYNVQGGKQTNVGDALDALDTGVNNRVAYDQNADGSANYSSVTLGSGQSTGPVALHNVAAGVADTDAVNMSQLNATNGQVSQNSSDISSLQGQSRYFQANGTGGSDQAVASADGAMAAGPYASASATEATAIGNKSAASATDATAIGARSQASGGFSTALGAYAKASSDHGIAIGNMAAASAGGAAGVGYNIAMGDYASASGDYAMALGANASATGNNAVALGNNSLASRDNTVSVGSTTIKRQITNVAAGTANTDAVNVSQLKSAGLIDNNGNAVAAVTYDENADGTPNFGSVTMGGPVSTDGGVTGGTKITNVAQGNLSATSTDAVNGSQLYATNQQVSQNTTDINNLQNGVSTSTRYFQANGKNDGTDDASAGGQNSVAVGASASASAERSVAMGQGATASLTEGRVAGANIPGYAGAPITNTAIGANTQARTGGTALGDSAQATGLASAAVGAYANSTGDFGTAVGFGAQATGSSSTALGVNAQATANNAVALGVSSVADRANTVSVGSAGKERQITNVAAGTEDTDAVNVAQLKSAGLVDDNGNTMDAVVYDAGTNRGQVTLGGVGAAAPVVLTNVANGVNQYDAVNVGQLSGLQTDLQNQINTVNGQVTNIDNRVTTLESNGGSGGGTPDYVAANASAQPSAAANVGNTTGVALGYNTAATGDNASAVGDSAQATGDNSTALGSNAVASNTGGTALGSSATVNANNGVAVGNNATVASSASNGTAVGSSSSVNAASGTAVGQGASVASTATNSVALGAGSVATQANSVSVGSAGNERTITNVSAGVNATDAVNVSQLQSTQNWAQSYVDQKASQLNSRITSVGRHADAGTAGAIAMTNIPQAYQPNQSSIGAGVGAFNGQAAIAVGMSTITPSGRWVLKGSLTGNSQGDVGVGFGASMVW